MYESLGYIVYRTVLAYYSGDPDEDAYGMISTTKSYDFIKTIIHKALKFTIIYCLY